MELSYELVAKLGYKGIRLLIERAGVQITPSSLGP